jgi:hypothetical protein
MGGRCVRVGPEKYIFVIPSEARNLSWVWTHEKHERFLASLGMTKNAGMKKM